MPETVLLVEDDPSLRRLVERLLSKLGYTVIVATGAEGAVARFTNSDIGVDLLITDVNMPGMRGPELAQRLLAARPGLKVLYVSGSDDAIDRDLLTRRADFLQKPFSTEEFSKKIREILAQ